MSSWTNVEGGAGKKGASEGIPGTVHDDTSIRQKKLDKQVCVASQLD